MNRVRSEPICHPFPVTPAHTPLSLMNLLFDSVNCRSKDEGCSSTVSCIIDHKGAGPVVFSSPRSTQSCQVSTAWKPRNTTPLSLVTIRKDGYRTRTLATWINNLKRRPICCPAFDYSHYLRGRYISHRQIHHIYHSSISPNIFELPIQAGWFSSTTRSSHARPALKDIEFQDVHIRIVHCSRSRKRVDRQPNACSARRSGKDPSRQGPYTPRYAQHDFWKTAWTDV